MQLQIGGRDIVALTKKTVHEIMDDNVLGLSAESAYSFFFGLFPMFLFAAPFISLLGNKQQLFNQASTWFSSALPAQTATMVTGALHDVIFGKNAPGLISVGAILALYGGAGMFSTLMTALNAAYDAEESRPWWKQKLIAVGATLGAVITIGIAVALLLGGGTFVSAAADLLNLGSFGTVVWTILQYAAVLALLVGAIWAMYMVLPNIHDQDRTQTLVGAVFAAVLWIVFTIGFRLYVSNFGSYNRTYGTVGGVIVLLTWMYWSMFAILAGGELNSELRAGTGSSAVPAGRSTASGRIATHKGFPHPSGKLR